MSEKRIVETTFPVRYAETDQMQIVHHASYVVWMEEGRSEYMRQCGSDYAEIERAGYYFAVTGVEVRYLAAAHYGERVTIRTWLDEVRSRQLTFAYEVVNTATGQVLVTGKSEHTCIDRQGRVTRIPEKWHEVLCGG